MKMMMQVTRRTLGQEMASLITAMSVMEVGSPMTNAKWMASYSASLPRAGSKKI